MTIEQGSDSSDEAGLQQVELASPVHVPLDQGELIAEDLDALHSEDNNISGRSKKFGTDYSWLPANRWGLGNVANLVKLPAVGATVVVGGPTVEGASGGPTRVIAVGLFQSPKRAGKSTWNTPFWRNRSL